VGQLKKTENGTGLNWKFKISFVVPLFGPLKDKSAGILKCTIDSFEFQL